MKTILRTLVSVALCVSMSTACGDGDDDSPSLSEAQRHGVGAACDDDADCYIDKMQLVCLPFKGGYCGLEGCQTSTDCPTGSACVAHDDGKNYCFLVCVEKIECNATRPAEIEANCSSNITLADGTKDHKACVPPS